MVQSGTDVTVTEPPQCPTAAAVLALHPPPLSQKVLGKCAFNAFFCHTEPVLGPPRSCFRENLVPFWKILQSCLSVIALSSWEEKRWNEKAGAGGKIQSVCWQSSGGSFGACSPRQPVVPADIPHYPLESRGTACRGWQVPPTQVVALLEVGQLPGDAFLGRKRTFGKTRDGSGAQIQHTWLSGLEAPKGTECGRTEVV